MPKRRAEDGVAGESRPRKPKPAEENDDSSMEEMDDDSLNLSQKPAFNPTQTGVGIIEQISLRNFMCHNRLDVKFGPHVNFIVGRNGSGKSAVITALVVGMGGKATVTSRGSTVKTFVKIGKQSADVDIRLRNRGSDAYRPQVYGDSIIIHRHFTSDGISTYKLKSKDGKLVSQKREELSRILDQLNIQVDNPVSILNQDTSRNFLNSKSPNDKYKFFLKATQLEQIKRDYMKANEQKEEAQHIIKQKVKSLPLLEKDVLLWERKYKALTALEDLKNKITRLQFEMAWSFVNEKEKGLIPLVKDLTQQESRLPSFSKKAEEAKAKVEAVGNSYKDLGARMKSGGEEIKLLQPEHAQAKDQHMEQKKVTRNAQMEVRRIDGALNNMTKEKDNIMERIHELQTSAQTNYEEERKLREEKIDQLQSTIETLGAQEKTTEHQLDQFRSAVTKYKNDEYKLGQDMQGCRRQLDKLQRNQQTLRNSVGNKLKRFGGFIPELTQHIEEYKRLGKFHKKPIGPLGAYFQLTDQKWALPVECCLKGLMNSFCCHDYHDEKLLEEIMSNVCPPHYKATIVVSPYKDSVYNVSKFKARGSQYLTILDVLQSDHPMVLNTLIDQRTIECVILIEDGKEARTVMDPDIRPGPPQNAREAFTITGDQVYCHPSLRYYSSMQEKAKLLTSNVEENLATIAHEIQELTAKINELLMEKNRLGSEIRQNIKEERQSEGQLMKIREAKRIAEMEMSELKNVEDPAPVDVTTLEEEAAIVNQQILTQQQQRETKNGLYTEQNELLKEYEKKFKDLETQLRAKLDELEPLKEESGKLHEEVESSKRHKKHYDQRLKEQEKEIARLKADVDKYQLEVEADIEKAVQVHADRINTRRTTANIESEILQIQKQIKTEEKLRGDPTEVTLKYKELKDAYFSIKKEVAQLKKFCDKLDHVVSGRLIQYTEFRRMIAVRAKQYFILLLNNRHYKGKMNFNHQKETLELAVDPAKTKEVQGAKDMKALSGGERSFSTVCFILALWDAIESPFRCLDEFDVFMDMVNRRISMAMMMKTAQEQSDKQFIFLSPQDMSRLGIHTNNVRIFEMPEPDRDQSVLPFHPVEEEEEETEEQ